MTARPVQTSGSAEQETVARHSLFWLVLGNLVGLLLALLLLFPSLGVLLQPLSYGRWVTVHLNASLYGWSSLPLIGLLFRQYLPQTRSTRIASSAITVWSCVLLFSIIAWLSGHTSGKLFMEWSGASRGAILFGMGYLALALGISYRQRLGEVGSAPTPTRWRKTTILLKILFLIVLSTIPVVLYLAANPALYPPINPDSGGATGGSLLGSTLAIVAIYWATPFMLGLPHQATARSFLPSLSLLLLHWIGFSLLDHGDQSHRDPTQIVALASLCIWVPLLIRHLQRFDWPTGSKRWLWAFAGWGLLLVIDGVGTFVPPVLDHWKFTNALVAHVHIAMAGMVTSFNFLALVVLTQPTQLRGLFDAPTPFWCWQAGTLVHALALLAAGTLEALHPGWLFTGHPVMNLLYTIRFAAGLLMATASIQWFWLAHTQKELLHEKD